MDKTRKNVEQQRLQEARQAEFPWRKWGPYLSERQWGTVREDFSPNGAAWEYFSHDQSRSRAYRSGEDGLAGFSDDKQTLCFSLALWNGNDPILKERMFGLTNNEGNHGEDVKEYYFYLDSTPTHSYMKYLYKYPQTAYPYSDLVEKNRVRGRHESEYELIDTGVFNKNRYFDIFVEYAKESEEELLIRITACNRGPEPATLHLLPTLWFRNTWSWMKSEPKPFLERISGRKGLSIVKASHPILGERYLYCEGDVPLLFTENETNSERLWNVPNRSPFVKDGINNYVVHQRKGVVNPAQIGTKASAHFISMIAPGTSRTLRLRLSTRSPKRSARNRNDGEKHPFGKSFEKIFSLRKQEADEFYDQIAGPTLGTDERNVMRQAFAGMLWSKQYYYFDLNRWLEEHGVAAPQAARRLGMRNALWFHMLNDNVISMPDKWEYPWYAAWDLAFHTVALATVDLDFAKEQIDLMLREMYLHPNGQIPAYEWNFGDVNPPVHAWAAFYIYQHEREVHGKGDVEFLKRAFHKLALNFSWWVNRKDPAGRNVYEGGFLGLDNIGVFDRSAPLPTGGHLEQADGTAWMAFFSQCMVQIALELALHDPLYEELAMKYAEHFLWIAAAMNHIGEGDNKLWDDEDGFFYDLLNLPGGKSMRLKIHSLVGLLPLCAVSILPVDVIQKYPKLVEGIRRRLQTHKNLRPSTAFAGRTGVGGQIIMSIVDETKLRRVLSRMLDETKFLSPYGIRSLSRYHEQHPYVFNVNGVELRVDYWPAESQSGLFGGNSNWRGPVWFPVNVLIVRSLLLYYKYFGDAFTVECPTGSGNQMTLLQILKELSRRLTHIFLRDENGRRPVYGATEKFQTDPHWKDLILFYEYFHGDNGAGIGASHQTGWTGLVGRLLLKDLGLPAWAMAAGPAKPSGRLHRARAKKRKSTARKKKR
jgi:hypothetical protein